MNDEFIAAALASLFLVAYITINATIKAVGNRQKRRAKEKALSARKRIIKEIDERKNKSNRGWKEIFYP